MKSDEIASDIGIAGPRSGSKYADYHSETIGPEAPGSEGGGLAAVGAEMLGADDASTPMRMKAWRRCRIL